MTYPSSRSLLERRAPAKLNLGLHILHKRSDGYHEIDTVMIAIGWQDRLEWQKGNEFTFECSDPGLSVSSDNLCVKAAILLAEVTGIEPHGRLFLEKKIPYGAGLGGGSSNAAHALRLLRDAWGLSISDKRLAELAASLGSDVPFFISGKPQRATGRGEILTPIDTLKEFPFWITVVMPNVHISTAEAYSLVTPNAVDRPKLVEVFSTLDPEQWQRELVNDFEEPIIARYPEIGRERETLLAGGAWYAAMSGSGAAVFGLFYSEQDSREASQQAIERGLRSWLGKVHS